MPIQVCVCGRWGCFDLSPESKKTQSVISFYLYLGEQEMTSYFSRTLPEFEIDFPILKLRFANGSTIYVNKSHI